MANEYVIRNGLIVTDITVGSGLSKVVMVDSSGKFYTREDLNTRYVTPINSGSTLTMITEELISGVRAVAISQSGNIRIAMASVSGRMPAVGIVVDNVTSGQQVAVYTEGSFQLASGLGDYSGFIGSQLTVGRSGQIISLSGNFGGLASGDLIQAIAVAQNSGRFLIGLGQPLQVGLVLSGNIGSGQIGASHLASGVLGAVTLSSGQVVSGVIASGQIGQFHLSSGAVNSGHIGNNAVVSGSIASGQIASQHIASGGVLSGNIASGQIGQLHLASGAVTSGAIASGSIGSFHIASGAVTSGEIGNAAVVSGSIASGQIGSVHIASGGVLSGNIASGQIGTFHLASGVLVGGSLGSGSVTSGFIGNGAVVSGSIASGQIGSFHIASGGILSGNIASGQIGRFHLASGAVNSGHIGNDAVNSGSIGSGQIGQTHLAPNTINNISGNLSVRSGTTTTQTLVLNSTIFSGLASTSGYVVYSGALSIGAAAYFYYAAKNVLNSGHRAGTIISTWDPAASGGLGTAEFNEVSTFDLGGTTAGLSFATSVLSGNLQLTANVAAGTYNIKIGGTFI